MCLFYVANNTSEETFLQNINPYALILNAGVYGFELPVYPPNILYMCIPVLISWHPKADVHLQFSTVLQKMYRGSLVQQGKENLQILPHGSVIFICDIDINNINRSTQVF